MSNKSVETQLKEAIEASKQSLALSEQVTSLAAEKDALSKRLAEIETAISTPKAEAPAATDPYIIAKLGELLAEREASNKMLKSLAAKTDAALAYAARLEKQAAKKADLNEYVEQRVEDGEEGNTPAEEINNSGKGARKAKRGQEVVEEEEEEAEAPAARKAKKGEMPQFIKDKIEEREEEESEAEANPHHPSPGQRNEVAKKGKRAEMPEFIKEKIEEKEEEADEEACGPKGKKSKAKAAKASWDEEDGDFGDLDDEEVMLIKQYRNSSKTTAKPSADSTIKKPFNEEKKDFGDIIPQPGLDPEKNNVNEDNTTHPTLTKKLAAKAKGKAETDVEEIMESPDMQESEGEDHEHEQTLSTPAPGAKKHGKKAESAPRAGQPALPQAVMDYIKQLVDKEKQANELGGINKNDVVGQPDQDEEESVLEKKDAKKGKAKAESVEKCVKDNCADDTTKVHEDGCAPTDGNTTSVGDLQPLAGKNKTFDNVVEAAVERFATVAKAKKEAEEQLSKMGESLALEKNAKTEAYAAVAQLQAKFEALMGKVAQIEASDKSIEMKAAKIVSATASEAVAVGMEGSGLKTDQDVMNQFEAIVDAREKNKFFLANRKVIESVAMSNLKRRSR